MENENPNEWADRQAVGMALVFRALVEQGGPTSGNWGHAGRPGKKGGSGRGGGFSQIGIKGKTTRESVDRYRKKIGGGRKKLSPKNPTSRPGGGEKVSASLNLAGIPQKPGMGTKTRNTVEAIDSVHSDGDLSQIPVRVSKGTKDLGMYAHYGNGGPKEITLNRGGDTPHLTMAHEVGHFLDHQGIGQKNKFISDSGHQMSPAIRTKVDALHKSFNDSQAVKNLRGLPGKKVEVHDTFLKRKVTYQADNRYINYLTNPKEVFARAYSQYIATKSKHPGILADLNKVRRQNKKGKIHYTEQWDDKDFEPISKAFDDLFSELGWMK